MKLPIAKEGIAYVALSFIVTIALTFVSVWAAAAGFTLFLFCLYFFRDPKKRTSPKPGEILSPAYGTVVEISEDSLPEIPGKVKKVGIFLSVFDVHMNYAPTDGTVSEMKYRKGKFLNALKAKAAEMNESNSVLIQNEKGLFIVKQIAGLIARRIVCSIKRGEALQAGEKIGLIQFGSRVDFWLPEKTELKVKKGDRVKGGVTVIGTLS